LNVPAAQHTRPLWLACLLTSLALPLVFSGLVIAFAVINGGTVFSEELARALGFIFLFGFPYSLGVTLLLGLPTVLLLRELRRLTALNVCAVGGMAGVVTVTIFQLVSTMNFEWAPMAFGLGLGVGAAFVFALIAGIPLRRPTP